MLVFIGVLSPVAKQYPCLTTRRNEATPSQLRRDQIFDSDPVSAFDDLRDPLPMTMLMVALVAEDADRAGLPDQRRQLVELLFGLRRLQMLRIDLVQQFELAAARGLAAVLGRAEPAQMQICNTALVQSGASSSSTALAGVCS